MFCGDLAYLLWWFSISMGNHKRGNSFVTANGMFSSIFHKLHKLLCGRSSPHWQGWSATSQGNPGSHHLGSIKSIKDGDLMTEDAGRKHLSFGHLQYQSYTIYLQYSPWILRVPRVWPCLTISIGNVFLVTNLALAERTWTPCGTAVCGDLESPAAAFGDAESPLGPALRESFPESKADLLKVNPQVKFRVGFHGFYLCQFEEQKRIKKNRTLKKRCFEGIFFHGDLDWSHKAHKIHQKTVDFDNHVGPQVF